MCAFYYINTCTKGSPISGCTCCHHNMYNILGWLVYYTWYNILGMYNILRLATSEWSLIHGQKCETVTLLFIYSKALFEYIIDH